MEDARSTIALNLSNQVNMYKAKSTSMFQLNAIVILGLAGLSLVDACDDYIPVSFTIDKSGDITVMGIDGEINKNDAYIYTDKKVTISDDMKNPEEQEGSK